MKKYILVLSLLGLTLLLSACTSPKVETTPMPAATKTVTAAVLPQATEAVTATQKAAATPEATVEATPEATVEATPEATLEAAPAAALSTLTAVPQKAEYKKLSPADAKARIESGDEVIILDVREDYEYAQGHIKDALLLPLGQIPEKAGLVLPDKNAEILLYCRSGNRSRQAAMKLLELGYTDVYDFGGIIDWPYETVK